jgi:PAS domain S-box-containing protein
MAGGIGAALGILALGIWIGASALGDGRETGLIYAPGALAVVGTLAAALCGAALSVALQAARSARNGLADRQRMLAMVDMAAILVRGLDGAVVYWSAGCQKIFGWTPAEAVGQPAAGLLQTSFPVPAAEIEAALMRDGEWTGELRQRTKSGLEVTVIARKLLRQGADGSAVVVENLTDTTALHQAEGALHGSQANLRSVVDTAADGIIVARSDGRIVSINPAGLRMFGYAQAEDLSGRDLGVLMPRDEAARHGGYIAAHRSGAPPRIIGVQGRELLGRRSNGEAFPIDLSVSSFGRNGERYLTGIVRDASVRRKAERAVRDSEARLRLVQQVGEIANADWTAASSAAFVSEEYHRLYGLMPGEAPGNFAEWLGRVHPGDRGRVASEARVLNERESRLATQFRIRRADGSVRWVAMRAESFSEDGGCLRIISAHHDITDMIAAREALAQRSDGLERLVAKRTAALAGAESQFRAIFDSQFQSVCLLAPDGTVLLANPTALGSGSLSVAGVSGRPFWETVWWPEADLERMYADTAEATRGALVRHDVVARNSSGRDVWIDFSLKPVPDPATGLVEWIIAEWRDVTELRVLAEKLAQAQKVHALGQLAGGIAHDFNNILQSVSGAASLIERRPEDLDRTRHLARATIEAAKRGASITQRLLAFARRGELRTEVVATAELLNGIRELLTHTVGAAIEVCAYADAGLPPLLADQGQLETALINLGTNARDAMPGGGTLTLAAAAVEFADSGLRPHGISPGAYVRITVADTGSGMDAATFARVAEPFFTTKPQGCGTGLGLAMVKGFAEQSGGAMAIATAPGSGTTVSIWLPRAKADAPVSQSDGSQDHPARHTSARILLVDDDDLVRETLAAQMEDLGFAMLVASGGAEAVALIEAGEVVDAMVSDLSMPGMNGVVAIQKALAMRPGLPCFLLTGYVGDRAALSAGDVFTLVRKPISGTQLAARIEARLEAVLRP